MKIPQCIPNTLKSFIYKQKMAKYYIKLFNKYKTINNEQQINTIVVKLIKFLELKAYLTVLLNNSLLPFSQD